MTRKTDPSRQSCGYRTGIMLHRAHGEEPCALCAALAEEIKDEPQPERPHARTAEPPRKVRDYDFPSIF